MSHYQLLDEQQLTSKDHQVQIGGQAYPVWQYGAGKLRPDCLIIGSGRLCFRSLPPAFLDLYNCYVCDLYWSQDQALAASEVAQLDVQTMAEHVSSAVAQLGLKNAVLMAHSCYGIIALESAKQLGEKLAGVILMASAPQWTSAMIEANLSRFRKEASPESVAQYAEQRASFEQQRASSESELSVNAYIADTAIYWGDRHVSEEFIRRLWRGVAIDEVIAKHFWGDLLPNSYRDGLAEDIDKVACPVVLVAGRRDYDSCPLHTWEARFRPSKFKIVDCGEVGHWPSLEAPERFLQAVSLTG